MNIPKGWVTLLGPLFQTLVAVNLGMALQRLDDGRASSLTVIAISMSVVGLAFIVIAQTRQKLAGTQNDRIGSHP
jgi:undecaprenyl pyrophosphate phosphatase UppP